MYMHTYLYVYMYLSKQVSKRILIKPVLDLKNNLKIHT